MAKKSSDATALEQASRRRERTGTRLAGKVVVQVLPAMEQGGVERGTVDIAEAVVREGGRAVVISSGGQLVSRLLQLGGEHVELPVHRKSPIEWPVVRYRVRKELGRAGANLVHVRSRAPAWIAVPAARRMGLPVVSTVHARMRKANPLKRYYNGIMVRGDRVIAISNYIRDQVLDLYPAAEGRLSVIPRGVDMEVFSPDAIAPSRVISIKEHLSLPDDRPIIMLPGRPSDWKGADLLIEAARLVRDRDFLMVLVGAGAGGKDYLRRLNARIRDNGLMGKVSICDGVEDMPAALMLADVVAMPSKSPEPFGRVAIEASAMGCPVVAFNHGGAVESVLPGQTGWLAEPLDVGSLANCLREALSLSDRERLDLSRKAREHIAENFTSERMCDETIDIYAGLLGGGPGAARRA